MRRARLSFGAVGAVSSVVIVVGLIAACGDDRGGFTRDDHTFDSARGGRR